jgi:ATP-dependent Clp protease, protease subunit
VRGGAYGTLDDMKISINEADRLNEILMKILAERTGKTVDAVTRDCQRDKFMSAEEALEYGLIDVIYYPKGPKFGPKYSGPLDTTPK